MKKIGKTTCGIFEWELPALDDPDVQAWIPIEDNLIQKIVYDQPIYNIPLHFYPGTSQSDPYLAGIYTMCGAYN
jgi:hypothetical protein